MMCLRRYTDVVFNDRNGGRWNIYESLGNHRGGDIGGNKTDRGTLECHGEMMEDFMGSVLMVMELFGDAPFRCLLLNGCEPLR